jgi:hypothetical protein
MNGGIALVEALVEHVEKIAESGIMGCQDRYGLRTT